uniref:beta-glucosidase n=1 Tax=Anopheles maculatus TaxID=74869 RepID=A0A182SA98_9DIPT
MFGSLLIDAVQNKEIPVTTVDKAVYRILTQMDKFHLLDGTPPAKKTIDQLKDQNSVIAKQTAIDGAVLLVNENNTLPLQANNIASLAVIGQTAASLNYGGGGSSRVKPLNMKAPLTSIEERLADGIVNYQPGVDLDGIAIPASALSHDGQPGLRRDDDSVDSMLDFTTANLNPLAPNGKQTITWSGNLTAPTTGDYELKIQVKNGGASLKVGSGDNSGNPQIGIASSSSVSFADISLISTRDGLQWAGYKIHLEAGIPQPITITAIPGAGSDFATDLADPLKPTSFRLAWMTPELKQQRFDEAVNAAKNASNVVLFAYTEGNEGKDLIESINLPEDQDALIQAVVD